MSMVQNPVKNDKSLKQDQEETKGGREFSCPKAGTLECLLTPAVQQSKVF